MPVGWYTVAGPWISGFCTWMPVGPVAVLAVRRSRHALHWLLAAAFLVSWVADALVRYGGVSDRLVSALYPVAQFGVLYGILAPRKPATLLLLVTGLLGMVALVAGSWAAPDALLRVGGSLAVVALVKRRTDFGWVRPALLVYFGLGALCWLGYASWPGLYPWLAYQGCRLVGLSLFTVGVAREH